MKQNLTKHILAAICLLLAPAAWAQTFTVGNLSYTVTDADAKTVSVAMDGSATGSVVIPPSVTNDGVTYAVTSIPGNAFHSSDITSITIPASVLTIGNWAFYGCQSLVNIRIEDSDVELSMTGGYYQPFYNAKADKTVYIGRDLTLSDSSAPFDNATSVVFGDKVTAIAPRLFQSGTKLQSITIGSGVKTIGSYAFQNAGNDESIGELVVTMGANVETIKNSAFEGCSKLKAITLPQTLTLIEGYAFSETGLTAVTIPASVDSLGRCAFGNCSSLATIRIEDKADALKMNNDYYGSFAFSSADKTVYIGRDLTLNGSYAPFDNATSVVFGDKVTAIAPRLFQSGTKLQSITIGSGVKTIGNNAFQDCGDDDSVEELVVTMGSNVTSIGDKAFESCAHLKSVTLPQTLTTIGEYAFSNGGLTAVNIPAAVTNLPNGVFRNCGNLVNVRIEDSEEALTVSAGYYGSFAYSSADKTVYIGRNLTLSSSEALFQNPTDLEFGPQVTTIDPYIINNSTQVNVKAPWLTPFGVADNLFTSNTYANATLWLPGGTKDAYQAADGWKNFANMEFSSYVITATASANGSVAVGDLNVTDATETTLIDRETDAVFTVTPNTGYEVATFTADGADATLSGSTYTIANLLDDHAVAATFAPITYNVAYDLAGGAVATDNPATYNIETAAFTLNNPTRNGYTFAGWTGTDLSTATTTVTVAKGSTGNRSYTATWTPITYNVTYDLAGGTVATDNPATYNIETAAFTLNNPTRNGYTFAGWTGTDLSTATTTVTVAKGSTSNRSYTATWTPVTYTITYDLAGGTVSTANPTSYNIETAAFILNNPTREHYLFTGWTGTDLTSATEVVTIAKGSTGNRSYTATWTEATYAVSISGAGVTASNLAPKYGESVTITIAEDPDRSLTALTVNGTDVTSSVSGGKYTISSVSGDVAVVATFASTKEFITVTSLGIKTFCCDKDLDFTGSDLRAYIAAGYNKGTNTVLLVRVYDVPANTGIIVKGDAGTYKIPYTTTQAYYVNMLVGVVGAGTVYKTTGTMSNYVLNNGGDGLGFYTPVDAGATVTNGAYLQVPTAFTAGSSKVRYMFEDEGTATDIAGFEMYDQRSNEGIYNMSGQKLDGVQRGLNIVNGKKMLVK